jgi:methyl-accepting chemotaxis protein
MDNTVLYIGGAVASGIGAVAFWMLRSMVARIEAAERDLAAYKLHVAETYVTSNELGKAIDAFNRSIDAIFTKLDRIESKVDSKADK